MVGFMKSIKAEIIFFLACAAVFTACADASLYLCNDPVAIAGYTDRISFDITWSGVKLKADVDYAVYAPGKYPGYDFTSGSKYIYAYQIFNDLKSDVAVNFFSVGIISGATVNTIYDDNTYGYLPGSGIEPSTSNIFAQSAAFIFEGENLNPREWSDVLIFSSIYSPTIGFGTVSGGGLCSMGALATPSIVPEPATIVLIIPALLALRNKNKNTAGSKNPRKNNGGK
jgi:hypothetical protein